MVTSIDAIAALFFFFFLIQLILFLMIGWITRKYIKAIKLLCKEFQRQSKFWHTRARKEAFLRDLTEHKNQQK